MEVLGNRFGRHNDWGVVTGIELVGLRMLDVFLGAAQPHSTKNFPLTLCDFQMSHRIFV